MRCDKIIGLQGPDWTGDYCWGLWYLPPVVKALRKRFLPNWRIRRPCRWIFLFTSFHQTLNLSFQTAQIVTTASFCVYSCIKSVHFPQGLFYSCRKKDKITHRFVLAYTAFSRACKINSVKSLYRLTCLQTATLALHECCFSFLTAPYFLYLLCLTNVFFSIQALPC